MTAPKETHDAAHWRCDCDHLTVDCRRQCRRPASVLAVRQTAMIELLDSLPPYVVLLAALVVVAIILTANSSDPLGRGRL